MNINEKQQNIPLRIICSKCSYDQNQTDECINCGVVISKYISRQKKITDGEGNQNNSKVNDKSENMSGRGRESMVPPDIKKWNWGAFL